MGKEMGLMGGRMVVLRACGKKDGVERTVNPVFRSFARKKEARRMRSGKEANQSWVMGWKDAVFCELTPFVRKSC